MKQLQANSKADICIFCGKLRKRIYRLNGFNINQCLSCRAASVAEPPSEAALTEFYNGFAFEMKREHLSRILKPAVRGWLESLSLPASARMLDIGGGAGFFAKAFEHFGFGTSSFIDLDPIACRFAKEELGINNVICGDIKNITGDSCASFDFIYCRHVIEHLIKPTDMIEAAIQLLKPGGILCLQFPNGLSLEYLAFPERLKPFATRIKNSNQFSGLKTVITLLSRENAFGLDPIRHLWAIPPQAIQRYLKGRPGLKVQVRTASIADPVFSPYFPITTILDKLKSMIARNVTGYFRGGAHGIVEIRKDF